MGLVPSPDRIEFGFGLSPYARFRTIDELVTTVTTAEQLGYGTVAFPEHLLPPAHASTPDWAKVWYDQPVLASFIAARTERILLMPGVHVAPYHPPVQAAKALATLEIASGGRLRLAVGVGWLKGEFERLGLSFEQRGEMTDEYLGAMRELWTSDCPAFSGRYVSFEDVSFLPQPGPIPIYIGGSGERAFRRVAQYGEGWYPMTDSPAMLRTGLGRIGELLAERGRTDSRLEVVCSLVVGDDPELAALRQHVEMPEGGGSLELAGEDCEPRDHRTARISPAECIDRIGDLVDAGATLLMVKFAWPDPIRLQEELEWFSRQVMTVFR
jgi:probable F420-dependent oxidoreductase